tara:strand:- start:500 stop:1738 length:1239 start_codon:yes stop_codon:yes gene_type:complete
MLFVLVPVLRIDVRAREQQKDDRDLRKETNIKLFKEREVELQAELSLNHIDEKQFNDLILELKQSLLADVMIDAKGSKILTKEKSTSVQTGDKRVFFSKNILVPVVMVLMIPVLAFGLYNQWGYLDDVEMMPLYERTVSNFENPEEAQALIVALGQEVQANENQPWAWYFLAENFANIGMFNEAEISYARSADLLEGTFEKAVVLGRVAMTKYINAELQFTPEVQRVVNEAREINPNEVTILQLLASNASANENFAEAIGYWRLLIQANPNSEQAESLRLNIASAQNIMAEQEPSGGNNPIINVVLSLREGLELNRNLRVFVAARDADQEGLPPLAAIDLTVANLPTTIRLDNSSAVGPFNLASANEIYVSALVSQSGTATPQVGDYRVVSEQFSHNNESNQLDLIISERVD